MRLQHPLSVDLHVERVVSHARLVVLRLLGGRGYWSYGVEQVAEACRAADIPLAALPGDDRPDPELDQLSTLGPEASRRLWRYLGEGGIANAQQCLRYAASLAGHEVPWLDPAPLLRAGLYRPGETAPTPEKLRPEGRPLALVVFYRALVQAGDLLPIDALMAELEARGFLAVGLFATSLKELDAGALIERLHAVAAPPAIVLNATGFTLGAWADPLRLPDVPILQVVLASGGLEAWQEGTAGLAPRDLAMSVALPEMDGRVLARAVSFKSMGERCPLTEIDLVRHQPLDDRVAFTADLATGWARLRATPVMERRIAIVLPNYPSRDGRLANGVGLDTPASTIAVLRAMKTAGYGVAGLPADGGTSDGRAPAGRHQRAGRSAASACGG